MPCASCSKELGPFPYNCKFCSGSFCISHRLPEKHSCLGLEKWKEENVQKPEEWVYKATREEKEKSGQSRIAAKMPLKKVIYIIIVILIILAGILLFGTA